MLLKSTNLSVFSVLFILFISIQSSSVNAKDFEIEGEENFPSWFVDDPFLDLTDFQNRDKIDQKKGLMVLYTTKGCSYCAEFIHKSLGDKKIATRVKKSFDAVGLEIFDDVEMVDPTGKTISIKAFAKKEDVQFAPTLLFYDNDGKRILHQTGYQSPERFIKLLDYIENETYKKETLKEYFGNISVNKSEYKLKSDPLFDDAPYRLDRSHFPASEPLLVIFEKSSCSECEKFHNYVLASKSVRENLKEFEVVRLDVEDNTTTVLMPDGQRLTPAQWYQKTNFSRLPALLFFDEGGNDVLSTDALVMEGRMMNSIGFMLEKAYEKNWTYQRFSRSKSIERNLKELKSVEAVQ